jgi:AhpD family alkylhydroperoxidase
MSKLPKQHVSITKRFKKILTAVNNLGKATQHAGPIDKKTAQLIKLSAASAIRSEGSVHSHTRRALEAGATTEEIYHTILLLTTVIGFPTVSAALSWADDIIIGKQN